jgi:hypothetical protein
VATFAIFSVFHRFGTKIEDIITEKVNGYYTNKLVEKPESNLQK